MMGDFWDKRRPLPMQDFPVVQRAVLLYMDHGNWVIYNDFSRVHPPERLFGRMPLRYSD